MENLLLWIRFPLADREQMTQDEFQWETWTVALSGMITTLETRAYLPDQTQRA